MNAFWIYGSCTLLTVGLVAGKTVSVYGAEKQQQKAVVKPVVAPTQSPMGAPTNDQVKFFDEKVRPVLAQNCYKCHTSEVDGWTAAGFAGGNAEGRRFGAGDRSGRSG